MDDSNSERTLIIAYEPTPEGDDAVALGGLLARSLGARPILTSVIPRPAITDEPELSGRIESVRELLEGWPSDPLRDLDPEVEPISAPSIGAALHDLAERNGSGLIVIGSTSRSIFGRALLGSVGEALVHGSPTAVAVAPRGFARSGGRSFSTIGVGYDGTGESQRALELAVEITSGLDGDLTIVGVRDVEPLGYPDVVAVLAAEPLVDSLENEFERSVGEIAEELNGKVRTRSCLLRGDPARSLIRKSSEVDLLVVGSRSYGPLKRVLLGRVGLKLMKKAHCPLVVLPRGASVWGLDLGRDGELEEAGGTV